MDDADRAQVVLERQDDALQRYLRGVRARLRRTAGDGPRRCELCEILIAEGRRDVVPGVRLCCACQDEVEKAMGR